MLRLLFLPLLFFFTLVLRAQTATGTAVIDSVFVASTAEELHILPPASRLDMIDLMAYRMEAKGENLYGGQSVLTEKSAHHLLVRLSEASTCELQLLFSGRDTLYSVVYTLLSPAAESRLRLLSTAWQPVTTMAMPRPEYTDFLTTRPDTLDVDSVTLSGLQRRLTPLRSAVCWQDVETAEPHLVFTPATEGLSTEWRDIARRALRPVRYTLRAGAWVRTE